MDFRILLTVCMLQITSGHEIELDHVGTVYVPYRYGTGGQADEYSYDDGVAEQIAVETERPIAYTIGMINTV